MYKVKQESQATETLIVLAKVHNKRFCAQGVVAMGVTVSRHGGE